MATADEQIRVSDRVKRQLDRRRREGESSNDVLERVLGEDTETDFYDGFGMLSAENADRINRDLSVEAGRIADEGGPQGPYLDGVDALVAAVGGKLDAPVVTADGDLTHEKTKQVIEHEIRAFYLAYLK